MTFLRHETVPADLLNGSLADLGITVPMAVALPPPQDRALSDVWSALGGELKPSLDVSIIAPLLPERFAEVGPPVQVEPVLKVVDRSTRRRRDRRRPRRCRTTGRPVCSPTADRRRARRRRRRRTAAASRRRARS